MTGYQSGIKKFNDMDTQVFGVSVDSGPTLSHWAKELGAEFPLLSDFNKKVATAYGVLNNNGFCNRTTFVIDSDGVIQSIEEGNSAVNPTGAEEACSRLAHKKK